MATKNRGPARFESGRLYGGSGQARSDGVVRVTPRKDGKGTHIQSVVDFPVDGESEQKAADYASELQRETRGYAAGGKVRGAGCAVKGKGRGTFR